MDHCSVQLPARLVNMRVCQTTMRLLCQGVEPLQLGRHKSPSKEIPPGIGMPRVAAEADEGPAFKDQELFHRKQR